MFGHMVSHIACVCTILLWAQPDSLVDISDFLGGITDLAEKLGHV